MQCNDACFFYFWLNKVFNLISTQAFEARRHFFNDEEQGYFKTQDKKGPVKNPISGLSFIQTVFLHMPCYRDAKIQ